MISTSIQLTGSHLAEGLRDEPEEMFYLLQELADIAPSDFAEEVAMYCDDSSKVAKFLRKIAEEMEKT